MAKSSKPRFGTAKPSKRRDEVRRNLPRQSPGVRAIFERPELVNAAMLMVAFIALASSLVIWSRDQVKVTIDQVMTGTRVNRLDFQVVSEELTTLARQEAFERAPDVYMVDQALLDNRRNAITNLPQVVASGTDIEDVEQSIRDEFDLDAAALVALGRYVDEDDKPTAEWTRLVETLFDPHLIHNPIVAGGDWRTGMLRQAESPLLRAPDGTPAGRWEDAIYFDGEGGEARADLQRKLEDVVRSAGFDGSVAGYVAAGLAWPVRPTYVFNRAATDTLARQRADRVQSRLEDRHKDEVIYARGMHLDESHLAKLKDEADAFKRQASWSAVWLPRFGVFGLIAILVTFAGGFVLVSYPRVLRNGLRITAICLLMSGLLGITIVLVAKAPELLYPASIGSSLFVVIVLLLAYDQRLALFLGMVQCALVTLAMDQGVGWFVLLMAGCGTMIGQLRKVRTRNSLIRASIVTAIVLGTGTVMYGMFVSPSVEGIWLQILGSAAWAVAASVVIGFLVLGILPSIEKLFDITTGMTLAELRDPSQPLLRQLQQRAPGTYNHSLQVANIAEAAAEAIGADSLLVYVGALYHDIGKMNKPEYFIENQAGGYNKHTKLRPAMSLLLIIGHVKDGIELAREYGLPRSIQHFIEAHHGTTLVEYFFHAARTEAESDDKSSVDEVEFRYPGPRPHTKEAAILMLADAVESATRAMTEPNPSRIENLVRDLSRKRLLDGQFDECELTFRELGLIEDAIIARICAIHHGRISYPSAKSDEAPPAGEAATA